MSRRASARRRASERLRRGVRRALDPGRSPGADGEGAARPHRLDFLLGEANGREAEATGHAAERSAPTDDAMETQSRPWHAPPQVRWRGDSDEPPFVPAAPVEFSLGDVAWSVALLLGDGLWRRGTRWWSRLRSLVR